MEKQAAGAGKEITVVSDALSTTEADQPAAPDQDLNNRAVNGVTGNNINSTQWTTTTAPAAASKNIYKNDEAKDIKAADDSKAEDRDEEIAFAKQQTVSKQDANKAEKKESKKKEESKAAEAKPSVAANTGYSSDPEQGNGNTIVLDSTGKMTSETGEIYSVVDEMPKFPGGEAEMMKYIQKNLKYPEADKKSGFTGKIYIRFIVDKQGNIKEPKIFKGSGCCPDLDKEALQVVSGMPQWNPGKLKGTPVNVLYTLPVIIELH